jgi:hypothetical protein
LEAQRRQAERFGGRMSAGELLQAAADDLRFDWLRAISQLIADFDAAMAADADPPLLASAVAHARELLAPPDPASAFGARYLQGTAGPPRGGDGAPRRGRSAVIPTPRVRRIGCNRNQML